eukprot:jgi/Mesen1/2858/ME000174S02115
MIMTCPPCIQHNSLLSPSFQDRCQIWKLRASKSVQQIKLGGNTSHTDSTAYRRGHLRGSVALSPVAFFHIGRVMAKKKGKLAESKGPRIADDASGPLIWPSLTKMDGLERQLVVQEDLFTVPGALSADECEAFIEHAEKLGFAWQGSRGPAHGEAYRDNHRIAVFDQTLADALWTAGLQAFFADLAINGRRAVGLNPNVRFYRYGKGQHFGPHVDESVTVGARKRTEYTMLVYLSGRQATAEKPRQQQWETIFYDDGGSVACQANRVRGGAKYILRSDVVFA